MVGSHYGFCLALLPAASASFDHTEASGDVFSFSFTRCCSSSSVVRGMRVSAASLQPLHQIGCQPFSRNVGRIPVATAPPTSTVKVGAFQTQSPVVALTIPDHQLVGQPLGFLQARALVGEACQPRREGVDFRRVHRRAVRPAPAVRIRRRIVRGFRVQGFCDCDSCDSCDSCRAFCLMCRNCRSCRGRKPSQGAFANQVGQAHGVLPASSAGFTCTSFLRPSCVARTRPSSASSFTASANAALSRSPPGPQRCTSRVGTLSVCSRRQ